MGCIYKITNNINKKIYIGLTTKTAELRFKQHISGINSKANKNCFLHKAFRKYGVDNFSFSTLIEGDYNMNQLSKLEQHYIKKLKSYVLNGNGYNLTLGGEGTIGKIITDESRLRMSIAQKNKSYRPSKETIEKAKISRNWYKASLETRLKLSKALKGKLRTKEWLENMSKSRIGISVNKGIPKTEEHKKNVSIGVKRLFENGFRAGMSKWCYIYNLNDELLFKFKSVTEASKKLNISKSKLNDSPKALERNFKIKLIKSKYEY